MVVGFGTNEELGITDWLIFKRWDNPVRKDLFQICSETIEFNAMNILRR